MAYRLRGICNHMSDEPCSRCWYQMHGQHGHVQGQQGERIVTPLVVSFPEGLVVEHAFDPWDTPRPVSSREELRQLGLRQGVTPHYLRDSMIWRATPDRWV
jgi:hypothetical protein